MAAFAGTGYDLRQWQQLPACTGLMTDRLVMPQRHAIDLPVAKLLHQPQIASRSDKGGAMVSEEGAIEA